MDFKEMRIECAWCGVFLRGERTSQRKSHGICVPCSVLLKNEEEAMMRCCFCDKLQGFEHFNVVGRERICSDCVRELAEVIRLVTDEDDDQ